MKLRRSLVIGAVAASMLGALTTVPAGAAGRTTDPAALTLRSLAARHGLHFGTAVDMAAATDAADPGYGTLLATQFSSVTAENAMKWDTLEPKQGSYDWAAADRFMALAARNHQSVRGHVLAWHNQLPTWLTDGVTAGTISKTQLRDLLRKHITDVVSRYRGKVWQWDVVNEAVSDPWDNADGVIRYRQQFWYTNLGESYVADAFRWARAADRKALLFYNDYNIDAFGDGSAKDKTQFVYAMVKSLRAKGVPVDGVGSQGHLSTRYGNYDPLQIAAALRKFAGLGVATALTEVDVRNLLPATQTGDTMNPLYQAQAADYSALLQGCLVNASCVSFTVWGFDDKHNWTTGWDFGGGKGAEALAAIYDATYQPKRALNTIKADLAYMSVVKRLRPKAMPAR